MKSKFSIKTVAKAFLSRFRGSSGKAPASAAVQPSTEIQKLPARIRQSKRRKKKNSGDSERQWSFLIDAKTGKWITIQGKPVVLWKAKSVLNLKSGFAHKLLCTGPTFNLGDACAYSCLFCYVEAASHGRFLAFLKENGLTFQDVVIRREGGLEILKQQLEELSAKARKFPHVIFSSTTVDVAANVELTRETAQACLIILRATAWEIRLLSKSNLLPLLVSYIPQQFHQRLIFGVSTGTLDDDIAKTVEKGTPLVSKRIESLHQLQDAGLRTYAMVCPTLPMASVEATQEFARRAAELLRYDRCEHVFAEPMNVHGDNFQRTIAALDAAGHHEASKLLSGVCGDGPGARDRWEGYARVLLEAHQRVVPPGKLRYLQFVNRDRDLPYWLAQKVHGAVILGTAAKRAERLRKKKPTP